MSVFYKKRATGSAGLFACPLAANLHRTTNQQMMGRFNNKISSMEPVRGQSLHPIVIPLHPEYEAVTQN